MLWLFVPNPRLTIVFLCRNRNWQEALLEFLRTTVCAGNSSNSSRRRDVMMRPASRYAVYLLAVTLFCGCGTTGSSRKDSFSPATETSSTPREYDSGSSSRGFPSPPPPAPAAYGVSYVKKVGFMRVFGKHDDSDCGADACADDCGDSVCCEKKGKRSFGDFCKSLCCKHDDDCGECATSECTSNECTTNDCGDACGESCGKKRGLFRGLCGKRGFCLFGCKKCSSSCGEADSCCTDSGACDTACTDNACCNDACCNNACGESACCDSNDGCFDWARVERECGEGCQDPRHPCLADSLDDTYMNEEPVPEQVPEPAVPEAPTAPAAIPDPPQAYLMSPFTGISSQKTIGNYFPTESGEPHQVIEPPQWRGRNQTQSQAQHHSVVHRKSAESKQQPVTESFDIMILPRQTVER